MRVLLNFILLCVCLACVPRREAGAIASLIRLLNAEIDQLIACQTMLKADLHMVESNEAILVIVDSKLDFLNFVLDSHKKTIQSLAQAVVLVMERDFPAKDRCPILESVNKRLSWILIQIAEMHGLYCKSYLKCVQIQMFHVPCLSTIEARIID